MRKNIRTNNVYKYRRISRENISMYLHPVQSSEDVEHATSLYEKSPNI